MDTNVIFLITMLAIFLPLLILFLVQTADKPRESKNPEKEIRRIVKITKPASLRKEFRKWTNPEIRQAIADQLSAPAMAELLAMLLDEEKKEILSYITDLEKMKAIRSYCTGRSKEFAEDRITSLYYQTISECKDPEWLVTVIKGNEEPNIRSFAAQSLEDQKLLGKTALWAIMRSDDTVLTSLMDNLEDPLSLLSFQETEKLNSSQIRYIKEFAICRNRHIYHDAYYIYPGIFSRNRRAWPVKRCRICGRKETPADGPESIRNLSDNDLRNLICDSRQKNDLRIAAAEKIRDEKIILDILRNYYPDLTDNGPEQLKTILIWQLDEHPEGSLFESIAADPDFEMKVRKAAITRVWDMDALDRLSTDPDIVEACKEQRYEVICKTGHNWKIDHWELEMYDENDWGSIRWKIPHYRCEKCGKTREGTESEWVQC